MRNYWIPVVVSLVGCSSSGANDAPTDTGISDVLTDVTDVAVEKASWDIKAGFKINGQDPQLSARSAIFVHRTTPDIYTEIVLTDVVDYCAALQAKKCPSDAAFRMVFGIKGDTPGVYSIEKDQASVFTGDVISSCSGAGLGASSGSVTLTKVNVSPGGLASIQFTFKGVTGNATGTINATFCKVE